MIPSEEIKSIVLDLGAVKCGIAGTDRFASAPIGSVRRISGRNADRL